MMMSTTPVPWSNNSAAWMKGKSVNSAKAKGEWVVLLWSSKIWGGQERAAEWERRLVGEDRAAVLYHILKKKPVQSGDNIWSLKRKDRLDEQELGLFLSWNGLAVHQEP